MSTKNEETKQPPADKVALTLSAAEKSFADLESKFGTAKREIREHAETHARLQEERRRESEQWDYEERRRRQSILDIQAEEDRERTRHNAEREAAISLRERQVIELSTEVFGVAGNPFDPKQAKAVLDKKLADAEAKGRASATKEAERDYATKRQIDEANAAKETALLRAENDRLKSDNAKLESENKRLSDVNTALATRTGDLALGAFNAASGIQTKANDSLQAAAQSGQSRLGR